MADSKRRRENPVDDAVDDVLEPDALADDDLTDDLAEDDLDRDESAGLDVDKVGTRRGGAVTKPRPASRATVATTGRKATRSRQQERPGVFARIANFVREVVAELRKVIWPTRRELLTYTVVVVVFVTIMFSVVGLLDFIFAKGVFWAFAGKK